MGVIIKSIEFTLPKNKENLKDLLYKNPTWNIKKIYSATGINNRYISSEKESILDLSIKSAKKLLKKFPKNKISEKFPL